MPTIVTISSENSAQETLRTDGCLVIYLEGEVIKFKGQINLKSLTPVLTKIIMEKMLTK